jgi:hypothetical protein
MRPGMTVLSSAVSALVVTTLLAVPQVVNAAPSEIGPTLLSRMAALIVAALGVYALCVLLLTTANLIAGILRVRQQLARTVPDRGSAARDWIAAFGANGFRQLAPRLPSVLAQSARGGQGIVLESRFNPNETRSEITRLHYIALARCHFFSALIVLGGMVGLGLAQNFGSLPFVHGAIPTTSAVLILIGLILITALGRIAIDVTADPLLEAISQMPAERIEVVLLQRAVELLEVTRNAAAAAAAVRDDGMPALPTNLAQYLADTVEQGHHALLDAVVRLSANTEALGRALQASVERLETTIRTTAVQQLQTTEKTELADAAVFPELQIAIEELTAVLKRLSAPPEDAADTPQVTDPVPPRGFPAPRLARELKRLLQEIEADR